MPAVDRHPSPTDRFNLKQSLNTYAYNNEVLESAKNVTLPEDIVNTSPSILDEQVASCSIPARISEHKHSVRLPVAVVARTHPVNTVDSDTVPIQIWEGSVLSTDSCEGSMQVLLSAKMGSIPEHTGTIALRLVSDQDADLVKPGAVFYLTMFNQTKRGGTIVNSQELQFRRRPNWSKNQLDRIDERAEKFLSKIKNKPFAD